MLFDNLSIIDGELAFKNKKATYLTTKYGTPLMALDIDKIRGRMREYLSAVKTYISEGSSVSFASKALCFTGIYRICSEEGMGIRSSVLHGSNDYGCRGRRNDRRASHYSGRRY